MDRIIKFEAILYLTASLIGNSNRNLKTGIEADSSIQIEQTLLINNASGIFGLVCMLTPAPIPISLVNQQTFIVHKNCCFYYVFVNKNNGFSKI